MTVGEEVESSGVAPWDPRRHLRRLSTEEVEFSRGFLRCRPERWFPGFAGHWLPLAHSIGCEARITEVRPSVHVPKDLDTSFVGLIDGEEFTVGVDGDAARIIGEEFVPGASDREKGIVLEYLARRFIASLARSWSGPQASSVSFEASRNPFDVNVTAGIRIAFSFGSGAAQVWIGLGHKTVERLDGLWRRQIHSTARVPSDGGSLAIEVAELGVPPQTLADYLKKGTVIDLEVKASDSVILRYGGKAWMPARLIDVGGAFGCEVTPGVVTAASLAPATTRLQVDLGSVTVDAASLAELAQVGAVLKSPIAVGDEVTLSINGEKVGTATLCVYEGRFAMEVA